MIETGQNYNFISDGDVPNSWHVQRVGVGFIGRVFLPSECDNFLFAAYQVRPFNRFQLRELADFCERKTKELKLEKKLQGGQE